LTIRESRGPCEQDKLPHYFIIWLRNEHSVASILDMRSARILAWLVLMLCVAPFRGYAAQTQARLILANEVATPGSTVLAGVHLHMNKGWHTYWRYGGDAGDPTKIEWQLPEGVSAGAILWPVPEKSENTELYTYVYHDDVVLLVPLSFGNKVAPGPLQRTNDHGP